MEIAVVIECIDDRIVALQPWIAHRQELAQRTIHIHTYAGDDEAFERPYDAVLLYGMTGIIPRAD